MKRILWLVCLGVVGALFLRQYVAEGIVIASGSMEPTLPVGRNAFVNKLAYRFAPVRRGDVVVFPSPVEADKELVKRVIALPGEEVRIADKKVYLNGKPLEEPYVVFVRAGEILKGDNLEVGVVPAGKVFLLGDNRDASGDGRDWMSPAGEHIFFIKISDIKGKLLLP